MVFQPAVRVAIEITLKFKKKLKSQTCVYIWAISSSNSSLRGNALFEAQSA